MRKIAAVLLGALVGLGALALVLGTAQAQQKITAKIADILSPDHPHSTTMQFFADKVKERTKGRVEFQVFNSAQLGQTKDLFMGVQTGSIEMAKMPASFAGEWIPEEKVWDLPYLFNSRDELWRVIRSNVGKKFANEFFPKQGLVGVFWVDDGGRSIYANKPVRKPEDLKGMKIRVQPSDIQIQAINEMGGIGTPLAFGEVYLALQQKVLDGAENSPVLYWTSKHWEVIQGLLSDRAVLVGEHVHRQQEVVGQPAQGHPGRDHGGRPGCREVLPGRLRLVGEQGHRLAEGEGRHGGDGCGQGHLREADPAGVRQLREEVPVRQGPAGPGPRGQEVAGRAFTGGSGGDPRTASPFFSVCGLRKDDVEEGI